MKKGYVYILANKSRTRLYIGVTNDLQKRIEQHRQGEGSKYTAKFKIYELVYFENISGMTHAINREKQLKRWHKQWKWNLIRSNNPDLDDLYKEFCDKRRNDPETSSG